MIEFKPVIRVNGPNVGKAFAPEETFFASDFHAYHKNMASGVSEWASEETREFIDEYAMTDEIVEQVNKLVPADALLIHAGDWSFGGYERIWDFRKRINCRNILAVYGNHDVHILNNTPIHVKDEDMDRLKSLGMSVSQKYNKWYVNPKDCFIGTDHMFYIRVGGQAMLLSHYAQVVWHKSHRGAWGLSGHSHSHLPIEYYYSKSMDIGIDNAFKLLGAYRPFSFAEVKEYLDSKPIVQLDHHSKTAPR